MQIPEEATLLRLFMGENDQADGRPLYEVIVVKAREMHLAGATVLRGPMGFGRSSRLHTAKILRLSEDLPVVIEIVDAEARIRSFLEAVEPMLGSSLITLEKVQVVRYGDRPHDVAMRCRRPTARASTACLFALA
jgi:PII-like signaling protein